MNKTKIILQQTFLKRKAKGSSLSQREMIPGKNSDFNFSKLFMGRRQWQPTPVLLPGKSHGWKSLVGCSPWGC